ncbi:MAG: hypothetical protein CMJ91_00620 [Planctomycetes bacterium]|nr:hypothetical protein [Planctomycetota bacterium]
MSTSDCQPVEYITPAESEVVYNRRIGPGWYVLRLREESISRRSEPGMFVQVLCSEGEAFDPFLRRPFSVYSTDKENGTYDILYTTVGRGTRWMAALPDPETSGSGEPPAIVDVLGPLGNTFTMPGKDESVYLVGGGVGVAPLYFLALRLLELPDPPDIHFCMGARTGKFLQGIEDFRQLPIHTHVATNDGSEGFHGFVTDLFLDLWKEGEGAGKARVYGCGPQGMNESLRNLSVDNNLTCEICLESIMACGFGICFGCVAPIRKDPASDFINRRICCEGPVFDSNLLCPGIDG